MKDLLSGVSIALAVIVLFIAIFGTPVLIAHYKDANQIANDSAAINSILQAVDAKVTPLGQGQRFYEVSTDKGTFLIVFEPKLKGVQIYVPYESSR